FGRIHEFAKAGSLAPPLANLGSKLAAPAIKKLAHVDPRRSLPELAATPFRRGLRDDGRDARTGADAPRVILLDDTFHNYFDPAPLRAAARVLRRAGFAVELPPRQVCCGRPMISKGLLDDAREY